MKKAYKLSNYEAFRIALQAEQNEFLRRGFVLNSYDSEPSGLEGIAIALGYKVWAIGQRMLERRNV